jgi:hypothetical protein
VLAVTIQVPPHRTHVERGGSCSLPITRLCRSQELNSARLPDTTEAGPLQDLTAATEPFLWSRIRRDTHAPRQAVPPYPLTRARGRARIGEFAKERIAVHAPWCGVNTPAIRWSRRGHGLCAAEESHRRERDLPVHGVTPKAVACILGRCAYLRQRGDLTPAAALLLSLKLPWAEPGLGTRAERPRPRSRPRGRKVVASELNPPAEWRTVIEFRPWP